MNIEKFSKRNIYYYSEEIPELLLKYLNNTPWQRYLDLGCGDGSLLDSINKKGLFKEKEVYVIDLAQQRIEVAQKINKEFKCFVDDACSIKNIKDRSIDFLVTTQVIEHVPYDSKMVQELARVLRKEGRAYITTVFKKWYGWYFYQYEGKWRLHPYHVREYTRDNQLLDILKNNQFKILENKKTLLWYPLLEMIFRKMKIRRDIFNNPMLGFLRKFKIPVIGYYNWEIIVRKC